MLKNRLYDRVVMRSLPSSYYDKADVQLARHQIWHVQNILGKSGIEVVSLLRLDEYPDSVFMQDAAIIGTSRALLSSFSNPVRIGEERGLKRSLHFYGLKFCEVKGSGRIEGGDVIVTPQKIFIGLSQRTNKDGINKFKKTFPGIEVCAIPVDAMHLMCYASYITNGDILVSPDLVDVRYFKGFNLIKVPRDEATGANSFYLGNGRVLIMKGYPTVKLLLKERGYEPVIVDVSEFQKADGSISCLIMPFFKNL